MHWAWTDARGPEFRDQLRKGPGGLSLEPHFESCLGLGEVRRMSKCGPWHGGGWFWKHAGVAGGHGGQIRVDCSRIRSPGKKEIPQISEQGRDRAGVSRECQERDLGPSCGTTSWLKR